MGRRQRSRSGPAAGPPPSSAPGTPPAPSPGCRRPARPCLRASARRSWPRRPAPAGRSALRPGRRSAPARTRSGRRRGAVSICPTGSIHRFGSMEYCSRLLAAGSRAARVGRRVFPGPARPGWRACGPAGCPRSVRTAPASRAGIRTAPASRAGGSRTPMSRSEVPSTRRRSRATAPSGHWRTRAFGGTPGSRVMCPRSARRRAGCSPSCRPAPARLGRLSTWCRRCCEPSGSAQARAARRAFDGDAVAGLHDLGQGFGPAVPGRAHGSGFCSTRVGLEWSACFVRSPIQPLAGSGLFSVSVRAWSALGNSGWYGLGGPRPSGDPFP